MVFTIYKIGIIGVGFVGNAIKTVFEEKGHELICYDKFKKYQPINNILTADFIYLCLPTPYNNISETFDYTSLLDSCFFLSENNYSKIILIKSTIETGITNILCEKYPNLQFIHNPEFLSCNTAVNDFKNQKHIVLGKSNNCNFENIKVIYNFYNSNFDNCKISFCLSNESESMKLFLNSFYSVKIQFFNELYDFCKKKNLDFENIRKLMLNNNWINPMHTLVPGIDGNLSYGGNCFPKDTNALLSLMKNCSSHHSILKSTINERNSMRQDKQNINETFN